ncbi:MAG: hypothetical protein JWP14_700 [Frankiales bacterium]|nr:hypothetical protein [Frankiales bacterium]
MPWVLVDVGIGVLAVLLLLLVAFLLYRRVRVLMRSLGDASRRVGDLTPGLVVQEPPNAR